ncbi:MAG: BatA domain-containing protein [Flavobacteriales bacterium]|nr:BatA domain-containing protein [Flavobacteriales bacterium]
MEFLYPGFLFALAALAVPVIIHLFNFRRFKKIPFTNVRFLRDIKQQTRAQNKLRHLLTLLARMLALTFLVLAFAQPFIPASEESVTTEKQTVSVFVDNSFSMEGESEAGPMIEVAKNRALDIAAAYDATDRFILLTQDFDGRHSRAVSRDVFTEMVQEVDLSPKSRNLEEILTRQRDLLLNAEHSTRPKAYIISDFQKSRYDFGSLPADSAVDIFPVHLERNDLSNLYIDSVWFDAPVRKLNESDLVNVRVVNAGDVRIENIPVRLEINGVQRAVASTDADPGEKSVATLEYVHETSGLQKATAVIKDSPVTYDDTYHFSYDVFNELKILGVRNSLEGSDPLRNVFSSDSVYSYTSVNARNIDYAALADHRLVILDEVKDIPGGVDAPPFSPAISSDRKVQSINTEHPLYSGVFENIPRNIDLPEVKKFYPSARSAQGDPVMSMTGGNAFLTAYRPGRGQLYVQASSLRRSDNDFSRHALFVATALRIAELSGATALRSIWLEDDAYFTVPAFNITDGENLHLVNAEANADVIPLYRRSEGRFFINPGPDVGEAGIYSLIYNGEEVSATGINYFREESDLASYMRSELEAVIAETGGVRIKVFDGGDESMGRQIEQINRGTPLWKICLILALAFLLAETLLLRRWKTSRV